MEFESFLHKTLANIGKLEIDIEIFEKNIDDFLQYLDSNREYGEKVKEKIFLSRPEFVSNFCNASSTSLENNWLRYGINSLYILHCTSTLYSQSSSENDQSGLKEFEGSTSSSFISLSVQDLKGIEYCTKYVLYSLYILSLNEDPSLYLWKNQITHQMRICRCFWKQNNTCDSHQILKFTLRFIMPLFKIELIRAHLLRGFLIEILCGLLQLSFGPYEMTHYKEDVTEFRQELEQFFIFCSPNEVLQGILLLEGLTAHKKSILRDSLCSKCSGSASDIQTNQLENCHLSSHNMSNSSILTRDFVPESSSNLNGKNWLKTVCQSIFNRRFLLREGGLRTTLEALRSMIDLSVGNRKEAIAPIISLAKLRGKSDSNEADFYQHLCPQILKILNDENISEECIQILSFVICQLSRRSQKLSQIHFFTPLFEPLVSLTSQDIGNSLSNRGITSTVTIVYKLFVQFLLPSGELKPFFEPSLCPLAQIASLPPTCHVKTKAQLILVRYLSNMETSDIVSSFMIISGLEGSNSSHFVNPELKLVPCMNEISIEHRTVQNNSSDSEQEEERKLKNLTEILEKLKLSLVVREILKKLAIYLDFTVLNEDEVGKHQLITELDINGLKQRNIRKLSTVVALLSCICESESLTNDLFNDFSSAVQIFKKLLETHSQHCTDLALLKTRESFIMSCIMAISYFVSNQFISGKITTSDWRILREIVPILKNIVVHIPNEALKALTEELLNTITTHGSVSASIDSDNSKNSDSVSSHSGCNHGTCTSKVKNESSSSETVNSYQEALVDVCSPHLPVRGHALITLTKLLDSKDQEAINNKGKILALFEHHLRDEDSYIYLASIEGLVLLSSSFPDKIVHNLTEEFASGHQTIETRLKLTEILTKVARRLGPLLPKYKNIFLNTLLNGTSDDDHLIRVACLSNLGEVCKELRFSVQSVLQEIFNLVENVVENDKSPEVKRAAVLLITLLLQGLGRDSLQVLQNVMLLRLYRSLKKLITTSNDSVLVLQAELAMEEINTHTKEFLLPKMSLSKKIFITNIPS